ncbi:MAG: flagellar hook capping FlgD N-terminal domain-containing protein [Nitrospinota bacterium]
MAGTSAVTTGAPVSAKDALSGATLGAEKSTAEAQKAQFLTLLVTQLRYQDPMNPMQGTEFTQQLAMFSSLEQLININKSLEKLGGLESSFGQSQAVGMLGKQVLSDGNTVAVAGGTASNVAFSLDKASTDTLVNIFDTQGNIIGVFDAGERGAGLHTVAFPARDQNGNTMADGTYTFSVLAFDAEGKPLQPTTFSSGIVAGVKFAKDGTLLTVGPRDIPLGNVIQITEPKPAPAAGPGI